MRMSITFAVETYSGGLPRICSIRTLPSFRSFLSLARLTRTSFARFSASIRWSRERSGACACVFVGDTEGRSYQCARDLQAGTFRSVSGVFARLLASSGPATPASSQAAASSSRTRAGAPGSAKSTVPRATSCAPHATNSSASRPVWIPPIPTIGRPVASWQTPTAWRAIGLSAGPERPPLPRARTGRSLRSRATARSVLTSDSPSAPAAATARDGRDVRMRGGELRVERKPGGAAAGGDDLRRRVGRLVDVGAREVELDRLDPGQTRARLCVVVRAEADDADPERNTELVQAREVVGEEAVATGIREADRVEHPVSGLGDPRRRASLARQRRDGLRHESVELPRDIRRRQRVETAARVEDPHATASAGARTREASSTGPSRQSRFSAPAISTTQP